MLGLSGGVHSTWLTKEEFLVEFDSQCGAHFVVCSCDNGLKIKWCYENVGCVSLEDKSLPPWVYSLGCVPSPFCNEACLPCTQKNNPKFGWNGFCK
jgi:hypothetical protein